MNLLIIGASGKTGRALVERALTLGHTVTAFVRNPARLTLSHPQLRLAIGDITKPETFLPALQGQEAVLSGLGSADLKRHPEITEGIRQLIAALEKEGPDRLIYCSSLGVGDSMARMRPLFRYAIVPLLLKNPLLDHEEREKIIRGSRLRWTIVRPGNLTEGPGTGIYQAGELAAGTFSSRISRADVADFMLKQLSNDTYLRQTPGISY